ncbi:MAG: DUF86 domain-containing protein [Lentisphaeria bacterium]
MSRRTPELLLLDILESIEKITSYTAGMTQEKFAADSKTIDAVLRNIEIIGEAAGRLPGEFTDEHPNIPWNQIRGMRNRLIHAYFGISLPLIWTTIQTAIPELHQNLLPLIKHTAPAPSSAH